MSSGGRCHQELSLSVATSNVHGINSLVEKTTLQQVSFNAMSHSAKGHKVAKRWYKVV